MLHRLFKTMRVMVFGVLVLALSGIATAQDEPVTLEFWHAMSGNLGELVDELVASFNDSQDGIVVNATFQGSYDDTYNALLAALETDTLPNVTQNFDIASQTMLDFPSVLPAYTVMEDDFDTEAFIPAIRDYYSDEQGMAALAFNSSTPLVYANADMLAAAGIEELPTDWTFSEFKAICDQIVAANDIQNCVSIGQVGWFFEQMLSNSGGLYFNNDNGRTGRASEAVFNQGQGVEVFEFLTSLYSEGYAANLGSTWTDTDATFQAAQSALIFDSTSDVAIINNSDFPVTTTYIPHSDSSERNGVAIGGGALWLIDSGDEVQNAAAWEFMKFMAAEEQQITWHVGSGYFPVVQSAQDSDEVQAFWAESPNFATAVDQLVATVTVLEDGSTNYAVLGGRAGPFPAVRRLIVDAYGRVLDDGLTPQEALDEAAGFANEELANYNAFFE
ncbi:MAG: ABC transporter substrate-binding protein [Phototrophicaceae bacterium]